ncbi:D-2-hydroxyacid dehydrogenase [Paeniglutamicibacter antarcticus]|uniref:D-2-hydroxyacid dehydrogenase n=1 Tax=Arthrobacter terrae TaxID=2935737 RepID=A0A931GAB0_9MICC|nr:NAD(P)-dependent oxidoreductase [Arthrobacter terrae]MBG0739542.1 D-2-hydroxyacid dehydrogenase [Arthrobacter terrae]
MAGFIYDEMVTTDQEMVGGRRIVVAVATTIEPGWVAAIKAVDDRLDVRYEPQLVPAPRFPGHDSGTGAIQRTRDHDFHWPTTLAEAEIILGWPQNTAEGLADLVRSNTGLRWVQATVSGPGGLVQAAGLTAQELDRLQITGVDGIQAGPRAEFAIFALLAFAQGLAPLRSASLGHSEQSAMAELAGQTLLVLGLGPAGAEVARLGKAFGMHVLAVTRTGNGRAPNVDQLRPARFLGDMLPVSPAVVLALPLTEKTTGLIGDSAISRMRADAVLVNIGHGAVIDERALVTGLEHGQPAAAVLDAFAAETLPSQSVLRSLPNVLISPRAASVSRSGNERLIAAFTANLRRYLDGEELVGLLRPSLHY